MENKISKMKDGRTVEFSLSSEDFKITSEDLNKKIKNLLENVLKHRFDSYQKRVIDDRNSRLNFACPYCGDSHSNLWRKRGNLYLNPYYYKCYNCGKYAGLDSFFKDFECNLNQNEIVYLKEHEGNYRNEHKRIDPFLLFDISKIQKQCPIREEVEKLFGLVRLPSKIENYLTKRLLNNFECYSWLSSKEQLFIFNLIPNSDKVLGFQIRNFKSQPKYLTYNLSKINNLLDRNLFEEDFETNKISNIFGILNLDFEKPITVFEGPLDSFLFENSVATCSIVNEFPFEFGNLRYFYDYDKAGREASIKKFNGGSSVFLWKKFLEDVKLEFKNKKMDLTSILVYAKMNNINLPRFEDYFSKDKYDNYWI